MLDDWHLFTESGLLNRPMGGALPLTTQAGWSWRARFARGGVELGMNKKGTGRYGR